MPKLSLQEKQKVERLKVKAFLLYKRGYSLRAVGGKVGKSYQWVHSAVKDMVAVDK